MDPAAAAAVPTGSRSTGSGTPSRVEGSSRSTSSGPEPKPKGRQIKPSKGTLICANVPSTAPGTRVSHPPLSLRAVPLRYTTPSPPLGSVEADGGTNSESACGTRQSLTRRAQRAQSNFARLAQPQARGAGSDRLQLCANKCRERFVRNLLKRSGAIWPSEPAICGPVTVPGNPSLSRDSLRNPLPA